MPRPKRARRADPSTRELAPLRLATGLTTLGAFFALAQGVRRRRLRGLDRTVRGTAHPKHNHALTTAAYIVCGAAKPNVHPVIASAIAAAAWPRVGRRALLIPAAAFLSTALDRATRNFIRQHRPPGATHHPGLDRYAFPSGHTTAATAVALVTAIELDDRVGRTSRNAIRTAALTVPVVIGASRIYLDEHWADDVLGGWLAGTAIACVLTSIMPGD